MPNQPLQLAAGLLLGGAAIPLCGVALRLIHGRGKGVQRGRVHGLLSRNPYVERFADAPGDRGGWGATIAWLRLAGSGRGHLGHFGR